MTYFERVRESATDPMTLNLEHIRQRADAGWKLVAIEWSREVEGEAPETKEPVEEVPYGMRISADCQRLEVDPEENQILTHMMELVVQDRPLRRVAAELNQRGYRTRGGSPWTPGAVFDMIPRLIDVGPRLFSTREWGERRKNFAREF
ncbi:MAG TPA: recombinase family protein [Acidobacteriaceae bacterium]|jgi:hypothetical protein